MVLACGNELTLLRRGDPGLAVAHDQESQEGGSRDPDRADGERGRHRGGEGLARGLDQPAIAVCDSHRPRATAGIAKPVLTETEVSRPHEPLIHHTRPVMPAADSTAPSGSGRCHGPLDSGMRTRPATTPSATTGPLVRKIASQHKRSMTPPPRTVLPPMARTPPPC